MESRIRSFLLRALCGALCVMPAGVAVAQDAGTAPQVIEPRVERRDIDVAAIDTEDFELTGFVGVMSVEDFETNTPSMACAWPTTSVSGCLLRRVTARAIIGDLERRGALAPPIELVVGSHAQLLRPVGGLQPVSG